MVLMPWACAFFKHAAPEALSRFVVMRTLTPALIMPSHSVPNLATLPCAFWMSALTPASANAVVRYGRSLFSQRADDSVSGRITPTATSPAAADELDDEDEEPPLEPQAVRSKEPTATAVSAIQRLFMWSFPPSRTTSCG